jgi:murein DD-endopeptidase MepM/ murein hydrolase activator NlpD
LAESFHGAQRASIQPAPAPIAAAGIDQPAIASFGELGVAARRARTPRRRRIVATGAALGATLALLYTLTAVASWPVASRSSFVSQWYHSTHRAIDVAATSGTRVVPIAGGRVVFAGWKSNCGGYQVWVSHGNGVYSAYYHLKREVSYSGESVRKGTTTLGYVGMTGCATGPHTHVEVWHGYPWRSGSYRVNPWGYIDSGYFEPSRYR